jgi:arginyl-tRNA synthetase
VYRELQNRLIEAVRGYLHRQYGVEGQNIVVEQPPRVELGEYAMPLAFELAKRLRKPPRKIAEEIVGGLGPIPGFEKLEVAGAGYINARVNRAEMARWLATGGNDVATSSAGKVLVEHTSINPNKAAHIGHLRNAILGDTFVRLLRAAGREVDIQNYIDNTGVQVADVVVGFVYLEGKSKAEVSRIVRDDPKLDYTCWDLYARVSQWYTESKENQARRGEVLHAIEAGGNELAEIADALSTAIVHFHLRTMQRLDIRYDFLPRESEILRLHFWDLAFQQLKQRGVLYYETQGKNAGCWVMRRPGKSDQEQASAGDGGAPDEDAKVIVRSNGTVGYVGKDIAYHLWKFGLLGRDFGYCPFYRYPDGHEVWISAEQGEPHHPHFGGVAEIYNVIDARQADPQATVIEALRGLGYTDAADRYHHFSYEMVALTPRCAAELGYQLSEEEKTRAFIEVSGRKGFGVKADDLITLLITSALKEVDARQTGMDVDERERIATQIAIGALRYFMLKFTKNSVIAFDFKDALSFEGETGPYAQYAVVRATNIFRKGAVDPDAALSGDSDCAPYFSGTSGDELWELWLAASKTAYVIDQCIATTEPAYLAKHAFTLAQMFNNFYHRHHILTESDEARRKFLLATAAVVRRELIRVLEIMAITVPSVM